MLNKDYSLYHLPVFYFIIQVNKVYTDILQVKLAYFNIDTIIFMLDK